MLKADESCFKEAHVSYSAITTKIVFISGVLKLLLLWVKRPTVVTSVTSLSLCLNLD